MFGKDRKREAGSEIALSKSVHALKKKIQIWATKEEAALYVSWIFFLMVNDPVNISSSYMIISTLGEKKKSYSL